MQLELVPAPEIKNTYWMVWPRIAESSPTCTTVPEAILDRWWEYCRYPVKPNRSIDQCPICRTYVLEMRHGIRLAMGAGFFALFSPNRCILVPRKSYHYVVSHGQVPPAEFLHLLETAVPPGSAEFLERLIALGKEGGLTVRTQPDAAEFSA